MQSYLDLLREVLDHGSWQNNRTGIRCKFLPGAMLKFDLAEGFPAITTRKAPVRSAIAEMIGFLRGYTSAADFRALGCRFWDANANQNPEWLRNPYRKGEDDLGQIYGHFWRRYEGADGSVTDQVVEALTTLVRDPTSRRMVVDSWKADAIRQRRGALPPCHVAWHLMADVSRRELSLCMWQRSCDLVLGIGGGNIVGYAFLLAWIARLTGYTPRWLVMHLDDCHLYENHLEGVEVQLRRRPRPLPQLVFDEALPRYVDADHFNPLDIERIEPGQVQLIGYEPHPPIAFAMAV